MPFAAPCQPSQRSLEGVPRHSLVRASGHYVIERHRNVGPEHPLDLRGALGGERAAAAVHVTLELHTVLVQAARPREREHLKATGIGEERTIPTHEAVQGP